MEDGSQKQAYEDDYYNRHELQMMNLANKSRQKLTLLQFAAPGPWKLPRDARDSKAS